ncbi:MAG: SpoIIE family protein phosphatase [Mariprofundus sp.]
MCIENFAQLASQRQPMLGQAPYCGDGVWTHWHAQGLFGLLCDGAGHGQQAESIQQQAISLAREMIESAGSVDLLALFNALHGCLKGSRGMVAVAFLLRENGNMDYIHIGDVSLFAVQSGRINHSNEQQGIIGYHMPTPRVQQWQCQPGEWLVMHSDGIRRSTTYEQWQGLLKPGCSLSRVTLKIMCTLADGRDDAACIVLRYWGERKQISLDGKQGMVSPKKPLREPWRDASGEQV